MSGIGVIGDKTRTFIADHLHDDIRNLALQADKNPEVDMPFALNQIAGWQTARTKLPSWARTAGIIYPPRLSMEQCSSEQTALYKAALAKRLAMAAPLKKPFSQLPGGADGGETSSTSDYFIDLTGGFGVDFSYIARHFRKATYVEQQEILCRVARNNFPLLRLPQAEVLNMDGITFLENLSSHASVIFLDPARRDEVGRKTVFLSDCTPNVLALKQQLLQRADTVILKLSPMLDWHKAVDDLNEGGEVVREVHIVSVRNECKELLIVMQSADEKGISGCGKAVDEWGGKAISGCGKTVDRCDEKAINSQNKADLTVFCANDGQVFQFPFKSLSAAFNNVFSSTIEVGSYLYEPNSSIMKAGCFALLLERYSVSVLGTNSHLYVSSSLIPDFPGRSFRITGISSFNKKAMKQLLAGVSKANLSVRNFPLSVAELRKRLKLKEGGDDYLFATTLNDASHVLLRCRKV